MKFQNWLNIRIPGKLVHVIARLRSASGGGLLSLPLTRGSAPVVPAPHWGQNSQTPIIGSRSRARHNLLPNRETSPMPMYIPSNTQFLLYPRRTRW